jgi:hypothetical protein
MPVAGAPVDRLLRLAVIDRFLLSRFVAQSTSIATLALM